MSARRRWGQMAESIADLHRLMEAAAKAMNFEEARRLRDPHQLDAWGRYAGGSRGGRYDWPAATAARRDGYRHEPAARHPTARMEAATQARPDDEGDEPRAKGLVRGNSALIGNWTRDHILCRFEALIGPASPAAHRWHRVRPNSFATRDRSAGSPVSRRSTSSFATVHSAPCCARPVGMPPYLVR